MPFGPTVPRENAQCPVCGSLERDRLVAHFFDHHREWLAGADRILHVAPERPIAHLLQRRSVDYTSIDIDPQAAMLVMDVTEMTFEDGSFDAVYCSNVLEHVSNDRKAIHEIFRVLRPGGWSMILVPLYAERSHEDPSIVDPEERTRLYGQPDHLRAYGLDVVERLAQPGFDVRIERPGCDLTARQALQEGIDREEIVFFCRKPAATVDRARS